MQKHIMTALFALAAVTLFTGCPTSGSLDWNSERGSKDEVETPPPRTTSSAERFEVERLPMERALVERASATFLTPAAGEVVDSPVFAAKGHAHLPPHVSLFIVASDDTGMYYLMWPPARIDAATGNFIQQNVRLGTPGKWELHAVLADQSSTTVFQEKGRRGDFRGLAEIPKGASLAHSVPVTMTATR